MLLGVILGFALCGLDVCLGCVVRHRDADDHIEGKQLVVECTLGFHIDLQDEADRFASVALPAYWLVLLLHWSCTGM